MLEHNEKQDHNHETIGRWISNQYHMVSKCLFNVLPILESSHIRKMVFNQSNQDVVWKCMLMFRFIKHPFYWEGDRRK